MKKIISFLFIFVFALVLVGCKDNTPDDNNPPTSTVTKYTVHFIVEDVMYKTLKIEENQTIGADRVVNPTKDGYEFVAWEDESQNEIDLDTYQVTRKVRLYAKFQEVVTDDTLIVDAVKEEGKDYYLVVGWWETTALNEDGTPKVTSSLTVASVRLFYANLNLYLKAYGATDEQIKSVQFRNYSTEAVVEMGEKINADGDVDIVIGVGNNINSTAGVTLFEDNEGKTQANMGSEAKSRYVALPNHEEMNNVAISVFDWIKTEVGQTAFTSQLSASQIVVAPERTDEANVEVTVYGDNNEPVVTQLASKSDPIAVPTITVPEGHKFLGYAVTEGATAADIVATPGVELSYDDIEVLLNGASAIALYPVIIEEIVNTESDLVVYIHVTSTSKISEAEANLVKVRFEASLTEEKVIEYVWVTEGKAADFQTRIKDDIAAGETIDVVIGGNATTKDLTAIDETYGNVSCGANHFADSSRKIIVLSTAATAHVELAKQFYDFMVAAAPELQLDIAYWTKNGDWVTADEEAAITAGINGYINTLFAVEDAFTTYNISIEYYSATNTKVGDLSAETKALNDGNGVGLIVGTGGNATNVEYMGSDIIEQKDCPTSIVAAGRKVSICKENFIYRAIYENYFAEAVVTE